MKGQSEYQWEDFFTELNHENRRFVTSIHQELLEDGYVIKTGSKENGPFISYAHPQTKRNIVNFLSRNKSLFVRIYADNLSKYTSFLNKLPEKMEKEIAKAKGCKHSSTDRVSKCMGGYDFLIRDNAYLKCRHKCFEFEPTQENEKVLADFIMNEREQRRTQSSLNE